MENKLPITVAENVYLGSTEEETGTPLSDVLEGITSNIQTQLNAKAPLASPTFTGTVGGITAAMVGALASTGGTMTGTLTTSTPGQSSTIAGLTSGFAIDIPNVTGITAAKYTAAIRMRSQLTTGYVQHTVIGQYRESNSSFGSTYIAVGGSDSNPTVAYYFNSAGNFTAPGNITAYSDERLKSNINTIPNALNKVISLRGVEFDKDGKHNIRGYSSRGTKDYSRGYFRGGILICSLWQHGRSSN